MTAQTKNCSKCKESKNVKEFSIDRTTKDGLNRWCRFCRKTSFKLYREAHLQKEQDRHRNYYTNNRERETEKSRAYYSLNKDRVYARTRLYQTNNKEVLKAHRAVTYAKKTGTLRVLPCEKCGSLQAEAHHKEGYLKEHRLEVQWLCRRHHAEVHRRLL